MTLIGQVFQILVLIAIVMVLYSIAESLNLIYKVLVDSRIDLVSKNKNT